MNPEESVVGFTDSHHYWALIHSELELHT